MKCLREQDIVKSCHEFENGCILMHSGAWVMISWLWCFIQCVHARKQTWFLSGKNIVYSLTLAAFCLLVLSPRSQMWGLYAMMLSICWSVRSLVCPPWLLKSVKLFARWQHLAVSGGLSYRVHYACLIITSYCSTTVRPFILFFCMSLRCSSNMAFDVRRIMRYLLYTPLVAHGTESNRIKKAVQCTTPSARFSDVR